MRHSLGYRYSFRAAPLTRLPTDCVGLGNGLHSQIQMYLILSINIIIMSSSDILALSANRNDQLMTKAKLSNLTGTPVWHDGARRRHRTNRLTSYPTYGIYKPANFIDLKTSRICEQQNSSTNFTASRRLNPGLQGQPSLLMCDLKGTASPNYLVLSCFLRDSIHEFRKALKSTRKR